MIGFQPRGYQTRCITKAITNLDEVKSCLIESPTGSGKTFMGLSVAERYAKKGMTVGWCAMRRELLNGAAKDAAKFSYEGGEIKFFSMFDKNPPKVDFLVVDEAQHDSTSTMENIHATIQPKLVLGLSATPERSDRVELYFLRRVKDAGIAELVRDGYLSKYDHYSIDSWDPTTVAKAFLNDRDRWGVSAMYFRTTDECMEAAHYLTNHGYTRFEIITGSSDRDKQLKRFEDGEIDLLINMMVLTEGWDCPKLKTVFIRDTSTKSPTVQIGGRVFRIFEYTKQIVQSVQAKHPFPGIVPAKNEYVQKGGSWIAVTINENMNAIIDAARKAIVQRAILQYENANTEEQGN